MSKIKLYYQCNNCGKIHEAIYNEELVCECGGILVSRSGKVIVGKILSNVYKISNPNIPGFVLIIADNENEAVECFNREIEEHGDTEVYRLTIADITNNIKIKDEDTGYKMSIEQLINYYGDEYDYPDIIGMEGI